MPKTGRPPKGSLSTMLDRRDRIWIDDLSEAFGGVGKAAAIRIIVRLARREYEGKEGEIVTRYMDFLRKTRGDRGELSLED